MSDRCPYPDCDPGSHATADSDALGDRIASAVLDAICDACAERDCDPDSEPIAHCPCTLAHGQPFSDCDPGDWVAGNIL